MQFSSLIFAAALGALVSATPIPQGVSLPPQEVIQVESLTIRNTKGAIVSVYFKIKNTNVFCQVSQEGSKFPLRTLPTPCSDPTFTFGTEQTLDNRHYQLYLSHNKLEGNTAVELVSTTGGTGDQDFVLTQSAVTNIEVAVKSNGLDKKSLN